MKKNPTAVKGSIKRGRFSEYERQHIDAAFRILHRSPTPTKLDSYATALATKLNRSVEAIKAQLRGRELRRRVEDLLPGAALRVQPTAMVSESSGNKGHETLRQGDHGNAH